MVVVRLREGEYKDGVRTKRWEGMQEQFADCVAVAARS
jgi:hypothetical protein